MLCDPDGGFVGIVGRLIYVLLNLYMFVLFGRVILEWVRFFMLQRGQSGSSTAMVRLYGILYDLTEPVLRPIRQRVPPLQIGVIPLDLSIIIVFFAIIILQTVARILPF